MSGGFAIKVIRKRWRASSLYGVAADAKPPLWGVRAPGASDHLDISAGPRPDRSDWRSSGPDMGARGRGEEGACLLDATPGGGDKRGGRGNGVVRPLGRYFPKQRAYSMPDKTTDTSD